MRISRRCSRTVQALTCAATLLVGFSLALKANDSSDADLQFQLATLLYDETRYQEALVAFTEATKTEDPRLAPLGDFNGPVPTMPLGGGSLAINLGDNAAALDEDGTRLHWDQRGNGDPRVVAGFSDIGAFETQAFPMLQVDTFEDREWRACTAAGVGDCSLRGAVMLANVSDRSRVITFDPRLFAEPRVIVLDRPLPGLAEDLSLDAGGTAGVTLRPAGLFPVFAIVPGAGVKFLKVIWEEAGSSVESSR